MFNKDERNKTDKNRDMILKKRRNRIKIKLIFRLFSLKEKMFNTNEIKRRKFNIILNFH